MDRFLLLLDNLANSKFRSFRDFGSLQGNSPIILIHASVKSLVDPDTHRLSGAGDGLFDHGPLGWAKPSQHVLDRLLVPGGLHTNPKPGILHRSEVILNIAQTV